MPVVPAVEVSNVVFRYGDAVALDGVGFTVRPGEIFGLLGPNGGGKTTLFRILSTLLAPGSGAARIFGWDVTKEALKVRGQIGVVFQNQSLDRRLSVVENLVHQGRLHGLRGAALTRRIDEALDKVRLGERRGERIETLSGGLRRRVELAKSLLHRPRLLLLDEPGTGIDPGMRREFWKHIEDLRSVEGVTVLLTTHLLDEADNCDRLAILDRGKLIGEGAPSALKDEIGDEVVSLVASEPRGLAERLRREFSIEAYVAAGAVRFEHPEGSKWAARIMEEFGPRIESATVSRPSLADVFIRKTGHGFNGGQAV